MVRIADAPQQGQQISGEWADILHVLDQSDFIEQHELSIGQQASSLHDTIRGTAPADGEDNDIIGEDQCLAMDNPLAEKKHQISKESFLTRFWIFEVLCCIGSVVALAIIAVVLLLFDQRSQPQWPHGLTINSLVSILTVILRATMLFAVAEGISQTKWMWFRAPRPLIDLEAFDSASRGVFGSLKLVLYLQLKQIAVLGAIITVTAVAIGPFTQQSIAYYSCVQVATNESATISRAHVYLPAVQWEKAGFESLNLAMAGSIYAGVLNPTSAEEVSFECSSGNCKFSTPYTSLGVCSACSNIVYYVTNNCTYYQGADADGDHTCTVSLPNGLSIVTGFDQLDVGTGVVMAATSIGALPGAPLVQNIGPIFTTFSMLSMTASNCSTQWVHDPSELHPDTDCLSSALDGSPYNVMAVECSLSTCVYTYESSVENGILNEQVISVSGNSSALALEAPDVGPVNALMANPCYIHGVPLHFENFSFSESFSSATNDSQQIGSYGWAISNGKNLSIPADCVFIWDAVPVLEQFFSGTGVIASAPFFNGTIEAIQSQPFPTGGMAFNPAWMEPLWNEYNATLASVSNVFAHLAQVMTIQMRRLGPTKLDDNAGAIGIAYKVGTCVRVDWRWLSFPMILTGLSCIFLTVTILLNRRSSTMLWKSSPLPLLFSEIDEGLRGGLRARMTGENMREAAAVRVALLPSGMEWRRVSS